MGWKKDGTGKDEKVRIEREREEAGETKEGKGKVEELGLITETEERGFRGGGGRCRGKLTEERRKCER